MRLCVGYGKTRLRLNVEDGKTVGDVKEVVRDCLMIGPDEGPAGVEQQEKKLLILKYAGAELNDSWVVADIGIAPGTTLRAVLKDEIKPSLYIYSTFNEETVPLFQRINFHQVTVADLRGIVSRKTGLPVSVFRLLNSENVEMYDPHFLDNYGMDLGQTIRMETWDGWNDFLNLSIMGFATLVKDKLSANEVEARYQMKVALYIAAHFGHVDLAVSLLRLGMRADEPVGDHPMRQWCQRTTNHIDSLKAPVHEAAEAGSLGVLRSFVHHNVCNVLVRDGNNLTPLNLTLRFKQKPCASFLLTKQWSKVNYTKKANLPLSIYTKMRRWANRAKDKTLLVHGQWKSSIRNPRRHVQTDALVGYGVQLDGFTKSRLNSRTAEEVQAEEEQEQKRRRKLQLLYEEKPQEGNDTESRTPMIDMEPETYFKSMALIHTLKLPKLNRWGRALGKAAHLEKQRLASEAESQQEQESRAAPSNVSSEQRRRKSSITQPRPRSSSLGGADGKTIKLPPIKEQKLFKVVSSSHQNLTAGNKQELEFRDKRKALLLHTGSKADHNSPNKLSPSAQSLHAGTTTPSKTGKDRPGPSPEENSPKKKKTQSVKSALFLKKARTGDGAIPLPMVSVENNPRPFVSKNDDFAQTTLEVYEKYRGLRSRDYAIKCLTLANSFKEKPWLKQVHQAMDIASQGVRRVIAKEPHLFMEMDGMGEATARESMETVATV